MNETIDFLECNNPVMNYPDQKKKMKKLLCGLLCAVVVAIALSDCFVQGQTEAQETEAKKEIENWNADSPAMQAIVRFVTDSANEDSEGFIPKEDRIAVFDMDGTLYGERFPTYFNDWLFIQRALYDDNYEAPAYLRAFAESWEDKVLKGIPIDDFDALERELGPKLYEGLTPEAYAEAVRSFKELPVRGFTGMTYAEAYFQPMVSLVQYLYEHEYTIYIVSATYRDAVRVMTEGVLDEYIPSDHVIGTDLLYVASGDENEDSMFYEYTPEDELVISGELFLKNQKTNKVTSIQREIGKVPVLAFGNSTGDFSMATYTLGNKTYKSEAYMLLCDDIERDYGDPEGAVAFQEKCDTNGFHTISMRDEFKLLYPEGVSMEEQGSEEADLSVSTLQRIRESGVLRVGTAGDYQPMSYLDPETDTYVGFDAALAEDLAASLGVEVNYVETSWPTLMEDTLAGKFDLAICGITITDARKEQALMTEGYLKNGKTVLCRAEDADKYTSLEAINRPEVRVMENPGGLNEKFARENLPEATLIIHDVNQEIPGLVASGKADVMITEVMEAGYYAGQDSRLAAPLIDEPFTDGQLGVLMPKGSEDLLAYVNAFLEKEKADGRIDELAEEYIYHTIENEELEEAA